MNKNCSEIPFNTSDHIEGNCVSNCLSKNQVENYNDIHVIQDNPSFSLEISEIDEDRRSSNESQTSNYPYYSMDYRYKGLLLIFAHSEFDLEGYEERNSELDIKLLNEMFSRLKFKIRKYKDRTKEQIEEIINEVTKQNFEKYASLVVAISSHGGSGFIVAKDKIYCPHDVFYEPFGKVETLQGKPKIFLLGPCRGENTDRGIQLSCCSNSSLEFDSPQEDSTDGRQLKYLLLGHDLPPDFLLLYSTIEGYYAYRNGQWGSHYLKYLNEALNEDVTDDFLSIICRANRKLSIGFSSVSSDKQKNDNKQCMSFVSNLTKFLKFHS